MCFRCREGGRELSGFLLMAALVERAGKGREVENVGVGQLRFDKFDRKLSLRKLQLTSFSLGALAEELELDGSNLITLASYFQLGNCILESLA